MAGGRWTRNCRNLLESLFGPPIPVRDDGDRSWPYRVRLLHPEEWTRPLVVYHCYGGVHTSITAAGIHVGRLPRDRIASAEELLGVRPFDSHCARIGEVHSFGRDTRGVAVKAVGLAGGGRRLLPLLLEVLGVVGYGDEEIVLHNALSAAGIAVRLGGLLSCGLGVITVGRPLVIRGVMAGYPKLVQGVEAVGRRLEELLE